MCRRTIRRKSVAEKFKEQPVGLGPYRFASYQPGIELVLEANTDYWRKTPHVKRLVFKSVPEATTRLAMLKKQEADVTYGLYGSLAEEVRRDPNLKLEPVIPPGTQWFVFTKNNTIPSPRGLTSGCDWRPTTPINRQAINEAETLGHSVLSGNIVPRKFEYALPLEPYPYDPKKAKQLLKEAGYAEWLRCWRVSAAIASMPASWKPWRMISLPWAFGPRCDPWNGLPPLRPIKEKTFKNLAFQGSGAFGNAATRLDSLCLQSRERSRGSKTLRLTPGTSSRP